jgi:ADP-heptose:LPS heptosyltransferase
MKKPLLDLHLSRGLGDTVCATPVLRKLYNSYGRKISVLTHHPDVFKNNKYVEDLYFTENSNRDVLLEQYEMLVSFIPNVENQFGVSLRHNQFDIRQYHASGLGFQLLNDEMDMEFYPDPYIEIENLPEKFILIHPVQTWNSRTWSAENWSLLTRMLNDSKIAVVSVGKDSSEIGNSNVQKPVFNFDINLGLNLLNKVNLSQTWWLMQKSSGVVTMDSGLLHLAGTTDAEIFQLGSSIDYRLRAPFRNGTQSYKYTYISGDCTKMCATNMEYSVKYWNSIRGVPSLVGCLENYQTFRCHPNVLQVYNKIKEKI